MSDTTTNDNTDNQPANVVDMTGVDLTKIGFTGEIRRIATTIGREPTAEQTAALESVLQQSVVVTEGNKLQIVTDTGAVPVLDYIAKALAPLPLVGVPATAKAPSVTVSKEPMWAAGRQDTFAQIGRRWAQAESEAALREALKHGNPWEKGRENRTRQNIIKNNNPGLAAEMKIKAGVR